MSMKNIPPGPDITVWAEKKKQRKRKISKNAPPEEAPSNKYLKEQVGKKES